MAALWEYLLYIFSASTIIHDYDFVFKGAFAIVEFKSSDAAEKAINGNPVVMSGSKLQVKRRERKNVPVKRKEKKHQQPAPVKEKSEKNYQDMYFMLRKCESVS